MEKKNINIWVVRTCTILLLTVFTIGRKYGEEQKAEKLINDLKQQPCACCLNFNAVSEVAKVIDDTKRQLGEEKEQLQNDNNQLRQDKEELRVQKGYLEGQLEVTKRQVEVQEGKLREEIQDKEVLKNEINNLKSGNNKNAGAVQVAEVVNGKLNQYIEDLNKNKDLNMQLQSENKKISEEKTNLEKELYEYKQNLHEKDKEIKDTIKQIEDLKKTKEEIENELKIKNEEIEKYKNENGQLFEEKKKLDNGLKELEEEYKKNYKSTVDNNDKIVGENTETVKKNTEAINNIKNLLVTWKDENDKIKEGIKDKTQEIKELNNKIKENNSKIEELNKEKNELNDKYNELDIAHEDLKQNYRKIKQEKKELEDTLNVCKGQMEYLTTQTNTLNDILKNTKTNVNMEEYASLYNSINAQKRKNINTLLNRDVESFPEKPYTFYIPFKFKDFKYYGKSSLKKTISDVFTESPGVYGTELSLYYILRSFFEIQAFKKFKEWKIIKVTNLKEIYLDASYTYDNDLIKIKKEGKTVEETRKNAIELPKIVTSPKTQGSGFYYRRNKNEVTNYNDIAGGTAYKTYMNKFFLDYSNLIELVGIDEYLNKKGEGKIEYKKDKVEDKKDKIEDKKEDKIEDKKDKVEEKEDLFLLELDFKDPECIALLEFVGKGNYGVVKKGLT